MMEFSIDEDKVSPLQISYITCHLQCSNGVILICCFPGFVKETRKLGKTKFDKLKCFQESLTTNALPCSATITPPPYHKRELFIMQGLFVPFACVGSGDPVRVLRLYTTNTLDVLLKHLLLRRMYNLPLPILLCYAQALHSETSYCYRDCVTPSACVQVTLCECHVRIPIPRTVLCGALYTACVDASRMVFWDRSVLR